MSNKVSIKQVQDHLRELLEDIANNGKEYIVQRDGKDCAVIVSVRQWRRRSVGRRLDALGDDYRLSQAKQSRAEQLLETKQQRALKPAEQRELRNLLAECQAILKRRAAALDAGL